MTPNEILDRAIEDNSNPVLYYDDPVALRNLLLKALGTYQAKAGHIDFFTTPKKEDGTYDLSQPLPDNFLSVAMCEDFNGLWHDTRITEEGGVKRIRILPTCTSVAPLTLHFFYNFREMDVALYLTDWEDGETYTAKENAVKTSAGEYFLCIGTHTAAADEPASADYDDTLWKPYNHVPTQAIGMILDYLSALIRQKNMARARRVMQNSGIQDEIPDDAALQENINRIEEAMIDQQAIIPMATIRQ
jgi:hypothetical protein